MNSIKYNKMTKRMLPKSHLLKKMFISFIIGGIIGLLAEVLINIFSSIESISSVEASNSMMLTFILLSSLFTALGFFDDLVVKFGAGLIVPITGFAHCTTSSAIEYRKEGLVYGIGSNIFKLSGSVILFGVVSAYIFGIIRYIIFGG